VRDFRHGREVVAIHSYGFAFSPKGRFIVSTLGHEPGAEILHIWPLARTADPLRILPEQRVHGVAVDDTGGCVVATGGSEDGSVVARLVDPDTGQTTGEVTTPRSAAFSPTFSADGRLLAVGVTDGRGVRIDVATREAVDICRLPPGCQPRRVGFVADDIWVPGIDEVASDSVVPITGPDSCDLALPRSLRPEQMDFHEPYIDGGERRHWSKIWNFAPDADYTLFVQAPLGSEMAGDPLAEVGCPYVVRNFDYDYIGLLWFSDLVWRTDRWVVNLEHVHETGISRIKGRAARNPASQDYADVLDAVTSAYRILLTRAVKGLFVWCEDEETRGYLQKRLSEASELS